MFVVDLPVQDVLRGSPFRDRVLYLDDHFVNYWDNCQQSYNSTIITVYNFIVVLNRTADQHPMGMKLIILKGYTAVINSNSFVEWDIQRSPGYRGLEESHVEVVHL